MRNIILILLLPFFAFAQQPDVVNPVLVQDLDFTLVRPQVGKPYKVLLRNNHALLAEGIPDSTWVTICYGCGQQPVAQVDTVDSEALTYTGWARHGSTTAVGWSEGTISYSSAGEATYSFNGTGVAIYAETGPGHGSGSVQVGAETKSVTWTSASYALPVKVVEFKGLPKADYTVTIRPVSGNVTIDFLVITR